MFEKIFNVFIILLSLFFIWNSSVVLFTAYSAENYTAAAFNVLSIVIWIYIFNDSMHDLEKQIKFK